MSDYVYLYRDKQGRPKYVGYGERIERASVHLIKSHNPKLAKFIEEESNFTIEVAGPFENEALGRTVETALISALNPSFNENKGPSGFRFRPLGVPAEYAGRLSEHPLKKEDFISKQGASPKAVIFVKVGNKDFGDGRTGYDPANPPSDDQILERTDRWWQLSGYLREWQANPNESPSLLIGVNGTPGAQIVIASVLIDTNGWPNVQNIGQGKMNIPTLQTPHLDAFNLRGRRIDKNTGIAFGGISAAFFMISKPNGELVGGIKLQTKRKS
jgi:hypothetical protein